MSTPADRPPTLCSHLGCFRRGRACYLSEDARAVEDWLCGEHAGQYGYCSQCGVWSVGQPQFEVTKLCEVCVEDPGW